MIDNKLLKIDPNIADLSVINRKKYLYKNTKWISYGTYIMTVKNFTHGNGHFSFLPNFGTTEYHGETFIVNALYEDEVYEIENKELYNNVSKDDKIAVTIKYYYDKDDKLIYSEIHKCHPYPITG